MLQVLDNWSNFSAYGLPPPVGLVRADLHRHPFRASLEEVRGASTLDGCPRM